MPIIEPKGLRGLNGITSLSESEYDAFVSANKDIIAQHGNDPRFISNLYNNQQFIDYFGRDAFRQAKAAGYTLSMRNEMLRDKIIGDAFEETFSSDKNYNLLKSELDTQGMYDLMTSSDYMGTQEREKRLKEGINAANKEMKNWEYDPNKMRGYGPGTMSALMGQVSNKAAIASSPFEQDKKYEEKDNEIFKKLSAEAQERRENEVSELTDSIYASILNNDSNGVKSLANSYKEFDALASKYSNHYNTFKDTKWLKDYTDEDKLKDYAKYQALKEQYGERVAIQYLDRNIQNRVAEAQNGAWTGNTLKAIGTTVWSDLGSNIALFSHLGVSPERLAILNEGKDPDKPIYDKQGNIVGYQDNENWLTNPAYWNDVYKYNTYSPTEIKAIKERGGISEDVNVREYGYTPDFFSWDTAQEGFKQLGHVVAGVVETGLTGTAGKAVGWGAKGAMKMAGLSAKTMAKAAKVGNITNDLFVMATTGLEGSQLEAMGTFEEQMQSAREKIQEQIRHELYDYQQSIDYDSPEAKQAIGQYYQQLKQQDKRRVATRREGVTQLPLSDEFLMNQAKQQYTNELLTAKNAELEELHKKDEEAARKAAVKAYGANFLMDYIKNVPLTAGIQKFKVAKGSTTGALDNVLGKNIIGDAETGGVKRVGKKLTAGKNLAKELGKQIGGGFTDEYLDGINASFASGIGNHDFDNYINKTYNPETYNAATDDFLGNMLAGLSEGVEGLTDRQNLYEGFIGAIAPVSMVGVNPNAAFTPKDTWKAVVSGVDTKGNQLNFAERLSRAVMNPLLATYSDLMEQDRVIDSSVEAINRVVADNKDVLSDAANLLSTLDDYSSPMDSNNTSMLLDSKDHKLQNAFTLIRALNTLENIEGGTSSPLYQEAMHTMEGLANGSLSEEEHEEEIDKFLADKDNKSILDNPNGREIAADRLQKNAQYFMDMKEKVDEIQNTFASSSNLRNIHPKVQELLIQNLVAEEDYKKRLEGIEEELELTKTDADALYSPDLAARYGTSKARVQAAAARDRMVKDYQKAQDKTLQKEKEANEKAKELKQELRPTSDKEKKEELQQKIQEQENLAASYKFNFNALEERKRMAQDELSSLQALASDDAGETEFTEEYIMGLDARDMAEVLNPKNAQNYSKKQQRVIEHVRKKLLRKDPEAIQKIIDAGTLANRVSDLKTVYSRIMDNNALAATYLDSAEALRTTGALAESLQRGIDEHYSKIEKAWTNRFGKRPRNIEKRQQEFKDAVMAANSDVVRAYIEDHPEHANEVQPLLDLLDFEEDAQSIIVNGEGTREEKLSQLTTLMNMEKQVNSKEEAQKYLEGIVDSPDIDDVTKGKVNTLLDKMEKLGHQRDATVVESRKQQKEREEAAKQKVEEEKKKTEKAAEDAAEKAVAEVQAAVAASNPTLSATSEVAVEQAQEESKKQAEGAKPLAGNDAADGVPVITPQINAEEEVKRDNNIIINEEEAEPVKISWTSASSLMEDDGKDGPMETGEMWSGTPQNPQKGEFVVTREAKDGKPVITFTNNGNAETLTVTSKDYEAAVVQRSTEQKITTKATSKKGKSVTGTYSVNTDADGFTHIKRDGGPAIAQRQVKPSEMQEIGLTDEDILGNREDYNDPSNYDKLKEIYDTEGFKIEDVTIRPDGTVAVNHNEDYFELRGEKAQKFLGKVFPELSAGMTSQTREEGKAFNVKSIEKKDDGWYFNGTFAGETEKRQVKASDNFDLDAAIDRQKAARESALASQGVTTDNTHLEDAGEDVQGKAPSLEEQIAEAGMEGKIQVEDTNTLEDAASTNGIEEQSESHRPTTLSGNAMSEWEMKDLIEDGVLKHKKGEKNNDSMEKYYAWINAAGIKLQNIIDQELGEILRKNPDAKVKFMAVRPQPNATKDGDVKTHLFLVLDYDNKINKGITSIHDDANGGVITSNGKKYLIIGTVGYPNGNIAKRQLRDVLFTNDPSSGKKMGIGGSHYGLVKQGSGAFFDAHPEERFWVPEHLSTEIVPHSLIPGYIVNQQEGDEGRQYRKISELLKGDRNPLGYHGLEDLGWMIQERTKFVAIGADKSRVMSPGNVERNAGSAFVLVPASNGKFVPSYIKPLFYREMNDGELKQTIDRLLGDLTSPNYAQRYQAVIELSKIFYFDKEGKNILVGKDKSRHANQITLKDGEQSMTFTLDGSFDRVAFMQAMESFNPRINITASVLMNPRSLKIYDEAGALQTDIAQLATAGSSYSIYALDVNGDMMKPASTPEMPVRAADNSDFREGGASQIVYNGKYYRETDGIFYLNGIPVTDENLIKELQYNQRIANGELESVETNGLWDSYLTGTRENPQGIKVNKNTKKVKEMTAQEALDLIEKIEKEKARKEREQAAKTEKQRLDAQDGEVVGYEPVDVEFDFDDETGELVSREEKKAQEEAQKQEEAAEKDSQPTEKDNTHKSVTELESKQSGSTQTFSTLVKNRQYRKQVIETIKAKWPDAPSKIAELEEFLKGKNVEINAIGTDESSIQAWITTLKDCR